MFDQIDEILNQINQAGIHPGWFILAGILFLISFTLAIRELGLWFLKVDSLKKQLDSIEAKLDRLISRENQGPQNSMKSLLKTPQSTPEEKQEFPLHH